MCFVSGCQRVEQPQKVYTIPEGLYYAQDYDGKVSYCIIVQNTYWHPMVSLGVFRYLLVYLAIFLMSLGIFRYFWHPLIFLGISLCPFESSGIT